MRLRHKPPISTSGDRRVDKIRHIRLRTVENHPSTISLEIKSLETKKHSISPTVKERLEEQVQSMISTATRIAEWEGVDIREAMNYVRSSVLFKDIDGIDTKIVDQLVGEYTNNKIVQLKAEISQKQLEISELRQEMKCQHDFNQINLRSNSVFISPTNGSIVHQLFAKARDSTFEEFMSLYNKVHSPHQKSYQLKPKERILTPSKENLGEKTTLQDYLTPMLSSLSGQERTRFLMLMQEQGRCKRPCCKWGVEDSVLTTPAQRYMAQRPPNVRSHSVYQNSNFNQYYERYCGRDFKLTDVVSITRTHNQEIEKIYTRIKNQQKQRTKQHHRFKSLA